MIFNWAGTVASMAVGFFLAPFILHRLGDVACGVWYLTVSVVGYLRLLDLGMQSSVLRFVSKGHTQGDHAGASEALSAALWVRLQISALVLLLSGVLAYFFPLLFKVPAALVSDARKAILLIGLNAAITMSVGVASAVLSGLNRYDLWNYVNLVQTLIRAGGVVLMLRLGHGIVAIAVCEVVATAVAMVLMVQVAHRLYPELRISLKRPKRETLRQIWVYSSYAFLTTIAVKLVYQADNLVVGSVISAAAVTFYGIANNLCSYTDQVVNSMGGSFVPAASNYQAAGDTSRLVALYRNGTRATLLVSLPIIVTLLLRGHTFISLWMGQEYAQASGTVLIILASSLIFSFANRTAGAIAFGVEEHKIPALWSIGEGVVNLILSIILAHRYGIYGVAMGTTIPSLCTHLIFWPSYIGKLIGLSAAEVYGKVWLPVFLAAAPFAWATYMVDKLYPVHHMVIFFLQVLATLPIFFLAIAVIFRGYVRRQVIPRIRTLLVSGAR